MKTKINDHARKYDDTTDLSYDRQGLKIEIILDRNAVDAKKKLGSLLEAFLGKKVHMLAAENNNGRRVLKVAEVTFYGSEVHALLDSGEVSNIMSK